MATYTRVVTLETLPTIKELLDYKLSFLGYSTQKRNIAYLIQLEKILSQIPFEKTLNNIHQINLVRIRSDILEGILYCSLKQIGVKDLHGRNSGITDYANRAKIKGLISKNNFKIIEKIADKRNYFHPSKQKELYIKTESEVLEDSKVIIEAVSQDLVNFFNKPPF